MFSGSYTAGLFYFLGEGDGKFSEKTALVHSDGEPVNPNSALGAKLFDWDGDGDLDVLTGSISGPLYFIANEGDLKFAKEVEMTSEGEQIHAPDGGVCFGDFDGDGITDLVLGDDSSLKIYYVTEVGSLDLGKAVSLVESKDPFEPKIASDLETLVLAEPSLGSRIKPCVTDWNGDGKLDILAGDYTSVKPEAKELTEAEEKDLSELKAKLDEVQEAMFTEYDRLQESVFEELGIESFDSMTNEQMTSYSEAFAERMESDPKMVEMNEQYTTLSTKVGEMTGEDQTHGFVWVFLQA